MHQLIKLVPSNLSNENMICSWITRHPVEGKAYKTLQSWYPYTEVNLYCFSNLLTENICILDTTLFDYCLSQAFQSTKLLQDAEGYEIYEFFFSVLTHLAAHALTGVVITDPNNFHWSMTCGQHFHHWLKMRTERWQWLVEKKLKVDYQGSYESVERVQHIIASRILLPIKPSQVKQRLEF